MQIRKATTCLKEGPLRSRRRHPVVTEVESGPSGGLDTAGGPGGADCVLHKLNNQRAMLSFRVSVQTLWSSSTFR
ncbi:hypothetical protein QTO34_012306 [Cnephaeus nilssonii]|uniref:Uncharacterized protein n=1 Tax=Cnephaeus nilssonii TaxID=3371016 RepID=A0AA40HDK7_CNENI|nr:hypothetical protein QTO34_012306 [Eptesicus nilssonii]